MTPLLLTADTEPLKDPGLYDALYQKVAPWRRQKIEGLARREDRILSLGAGLLLGHALTLEEADPHRAPAYGAHGKPYYPGLPAVHFSLSHCPGRVLCLLADREAGCDVEPADRGDIRVAARYFTPEEYARILEAPDEAARRRMFCRFWTLKESLMKCTGLGFALIPSAFEIKVGEPVLWNGFTYDVYEYDLPGGYHCACCLKWKGESPGEPPSLIQVKFGEEPFC